MPFLKQVPAAQLRVSFVRVYCGPSIIRYSSFSEETRNLEFYEKSDFYTLATNSIEKNLKVKQNWGCRFVNSAVDNIGYTT